MEGESFKIFMHKLNSVLLLKHVASIEAAAWRKELVCVCTSIEEQ